MLCKHCGTEIADNALVCYRCGRATVEPRVAPSTDGGRNWSRVIAIVMLVLAIAVSITLRKAVSDQTTRNAIGLSEVALIAILTFRIVRSR